MGKKADQRKQRKEKERRKRKEIARQKETLSVQYTSEHKKQGVRNTMILIGLSLVAAATIIYFVDSM